MKAPDLFVYVTGAGISRTIDRLLRKTVNTGWTTYVVATPNVGLVVDPEQVLDVPGVTWIREYEQPPLDIFPFGTMLVAPCTFNTFNKLANGIADTLATSMIADALGANYPIFVAPSMNPGLWNHPQTSTSYQRLKDWGCRIIDPQIGEDFVTMASIETIFAALREHFAHDFH